MIKTAYSSSAGSFWKGFGALSKNNPDKVIRVISAVRLQFLNRKTISKTGGEELETCCSFPSGDGLTKEDQVALWEM